MKLITCLPQAPTTYPITVCHAGLRRQNSVCHEGLNTTAHCTAMFHNSKLTGSILYFARAFDSTVLMPLNDIATEQTKAAEKTQAATNQILDYLTTHPDATIRYHASDMILNIHSDASYLLVSNARSPLGGLFFSGQQIPRATHT
jgi:hypothetical protein